MSKSAKAMIVSILVCLSVGYVGSFFTTPSLYPWYESLKKPVFQPPSWVFGPVWSVLYVMMGISISWIWMGRHALRTRAILVFSLQLIFNLLWSLVFFGLRLPGVGLLVIVCLWGAIFYTIRLFSWMHLQAGLMLIPYILWVSFAMVLNIAIVLLN
jgi:translocator protein